MDKKTHLTTFMHLFLTQFIRIKGVITWSSVSFIGFLLGMSSLVITNYIISFIIFIIATICITSFTFSINNYYDIESDKKNPKKIVLNALASGTIQKQTGLNFLILFFAIPLLLTILYKIEVFLICLIFLIWMWSYSSPPLRLKGRAGIDILWHFIAFFLLITWASLFSGSLNQITWLVAISIGLFSCIGQIINHIEDYEYDKETGTKTFVVYLGLSKAKTALKINITLHLFLLFFLIFFYTIPYLHTVIILLLGSVGIILVSKRKKESALSTLSYFVIVFGFLVYLNCIIYHISYLWGLEPIYSIPLFPSFL